MHLLFFAYVCFVALIFPADISAAECFDVLCKYCCAADAAPSWRVFRAFICFMEPVLTGFQSYSKYLQVRSGINCRNHWSVSHLNM